MTSAGLRTARLAALIHIAVMKNASAQVCDIPPGFALENLSASVDATYQNLLFPQASGWTGGDGGHSIPLPGSKVLWLFSDSLIGTAQSGARDLDAFINNSIAIQDLSGGAPGTIQYYWDTSAGHNSFFPHQSGTPGEWYWIAAGALLDDELFIICHSVEPGGVFATGAGTTLIRVPDYTDPPDQWVQNAFDMGIPPTLGGEEFTFIAATYVEEPYLYVMTLTGNGGLGDQGLGRALIADLEAGGLGEVFEFWTTGVGGNAWRNTTAGLIPLYSGGMTEVEIVRDNALGLYIVFTAGVFDANLTIRTAPALTGPWSDEACIYQVPEVQLDPANIIVYEHRSHHPELSSTPGEIVLTYQTNWIGPNGFANIFTPQGLDIYYPHFLRLTYDVPLRASRQWSLYK